MGRVGVRGTAGLASLAVLLAGCGGGTPAPPDPTDPTVAADRLVAALSAGDVRGIPATTDLQAELDQIMAGMDGVRPTVTHGEVRRTAGAAEVPLTYVWPFAAAKWEYTSTGTLTWSGTEWRVAWTAGMIHPELTSQTRLVHTSRPAPRGRILDGAQAALAEERPVLRIGLDKSRVPPAEWDAAARALADRLGVNADRFAARVQAYGPDAFVEAITLRHDADQPEGWRELPGAIGLQDSRALAVDRDFAPEIIGVVGAATAEQAQQAGPPVLTGDPIGLSGLQRRQDPALRGRAGAVVRLAPRPSTTGALTPATPTAPPTPIPRPLLFEAEPLAGRDVHTTFDADLQLRAERVMDTTAGSAALVAVRPSDGAVVAAAVSPGSGTDPHATFGHFPPGSTFKIVTALALLRAGFTPDSPVECTATVTVDGRTFKNFTGYPADKLGRITLREAIAQSCNTALIAEHARISPADLQRAAASLGLGQDYEAGFSSFFGAVPDPRNTVAFAESLIGQGSVEASPLAMAGVAASVAAGRTVVPWLVRGYAPPDPAAPLSADEAAALRSMMSAAVASGTATGLTGVLAGAKTGTAEFGTASPPATHAWLIGYADDLAVAVWVHDGTSGSAAAAPILRAFLAGS
ncbi:penicillin-binding transpeptidase domain-containing protein [Granulicoccus sp. GXG6511]|uniref:penicillin-binding transpeptidase domain-containing protein n=1 Tax=Granulicoccus sp. GXG6511 TaxID=3381351 RepID=UPI003D7DBECC